jgi:hypothetical protein
MFELFKLFFGRELGVLRSEKKATVYDIIPYS